MDNFGRGSKELLIWKEEFEARWLFLLNFWNDFSEIVSFELLSLVYFSGYSEG
jgi:hypothetical protein